MAIRGFDFKWYDDFFLSILATSVIIVAIDWKRYHRCEYLLHIWIVICLSLLLQVDYTTVFIFHVLMFVDNGLADGLGLDFGSQQRNTGCCGRVVVLSLLSLLLYSFLWAWTLPEEGQEWGFLIWLIFSYCGLLCVACICVEKGPDLAIETAGQEMRDIGQDAATYYHGLYLTPAQTEAVEALIKELPKFRLKTVPNECGECLICLEEFHVGHEVRGLPCAHNFHVDCIE